MQNCLVFCLLANSLEFLSTRFALDTVNTRVGTHTQSRLLGKNHAWKCHLYRSFEEAAFIQSPFSVECLLLVVAPVQPEATNEEGRRVRYSIVESTNDTKVRDSIAEPAPRLSESAAEIRRMRTRRQGEHPQTELHCARIGRVSSEHQERISVMRSNRYLLHVTSSTLKRLSECHKGTVTVDEELLSQTVLEDLSEEPEEEYDPNYVDPLLAISHDHR